VTSYNYLVQVLTVATQVGNIVMKQHHVKEDRAF